MGEGQRPKHFQRPNRSQQVGLFDLFGHCKTFGSADFREGGGNISSRLGVECLHYYSGFKTLNGDTEKHKIYECIVGFFTSFKYYAFSQKFKWDQEAGIPRSGTKNLERTGDVCCTGKLESSYSFGSCSSTPHVFFLIWNSLSKFPSCWHSSLW